MRLIAKLAACVLVTLLLHVSALRGQDNLIANGSFALDQDQDRQPDSWATAGAASVKQTLTIDAGPDGLMAGRLTCTEFASGTSSSHAMVCQVGHVALTQGQWYRLTWRAKALNMQINAVRVSLPNTRSWSDSGLNYSFPVSKGWREYEHVFQSGQDLRAADSRLQFWFTSTGSLWLADVSLVPVEGLKYEYHPQINTAGVTNFIPNSSFECGTAGWGSYNPEMSTWAGNVFRLIGKVDDQTALYGTQSLRIQVVRGEAPVFMWDWFDLVKDEILTPLAVHHGWVPVQKGATYVFSCDLRADQPNTPGRLMVREGEHSKVKMVKVGTQWQRFSMTITASEDYAWVGVGPDLQGAGIDAATMWIDGVQFQESDTATNYEPRNGVESCVETGVAGNTFYDSARGLSIRIAAYNSTDSDSVVRGMFTLTDFFDQPVHEQQVSFPVGARSSAVARLNNLMKGRTGFFRATWSPSGRSAQPQSLRCMVIEPYDVEDSVFGMNHAYGWPFMLQTAKRAGLRWWRDWSVKWHEVEPVRGQFDFSGTDPQIDRVVDEGLNLEVMFPFPSCDWSTTADMAAIKNAEPNEYRHRVMRFACAPNSEPDFRNYIARSVRQYRNRIEYYQVFNEPVYTHYSLPRRLGYKVSDYIHWMNIATDEIRAEQQDAVIVGGMGNWSSSSWTHDFVRQDGLANIDILDLHNYPVTANPESYEPDMAELRRMMKVRDQLRPIWLTEFGCYADDDPHRTPQQVGDSAMSKCVWPSEREAAEALVQSAAVFCTHGLRKIFLHAGSCGPINGSSTGGVFFEYGGTPRKMLPAVWAFSQLVDADFQPLETGPQPPDMRLYLFQVKRGVLAIAWTREDHPVRVTATGDIQVFDMMGNSLLNRAVRLTATPVYFLSPTMTPQMLKSILSSRP